MFAKALIVAAIATLAAAQSSVLTFTRVPNPITNGQPQAITYATNDTLSPVTIILQKGPSSDLVTVATLTTDNRNGQFIWTPSLSLPNGQDYYLGISQGNQNNTFGPFTVQGFRPDAATANSTSSTTMSSNMTMTSFVGTSMGTGTALPRNTTMSRPTLSSPTTVLPTTSAPETSPTPTGAGATLKAGGAIAAILGAAAAALL